MKQHSSAVVELRLNKNVLMSVIVIGLAVLLNQACGVIESVNKNCTGSDLEAGCNSVFGSQARDQEEEAKKAEADRKRRDALAVSQQGELTAHQAQLLAQQLQINELTARLAALNSQVARNIASIINLSSTVAASGAEQDALNAQVDSLQSETNLLQTQVAMLLLQDSIVSMIDPCGNGPAYDEVLLRTKSGQTIAYFQSGSNEFLTVLEPGTYRTTDTQQCNFTMSATGQVCDSLGCR